MDRKEIAEVIRRSLFENRRELATQFDSAREEIGYFVLDDLLPDEWVAEIYKAFPNDRDMVYKRTLSEHKYIGVEMSRYHSLLEETLYAFQQAPVVEIIREICRLSDVRPDELLYAGGISTMGYGGYLQPHLDNSHNWNRELWRVLNVLYYVSPDWNFSQGGNLEI